MKVILLIVAFLGVYQVNFVHAQCRIVQEGEVRIYSLQKCLDVAGYDGRGNVAEYNCDWHADQHFILCEDGTIRNQAAQQHCLTADYNGHGNVVFSPCLVRQGIPSFQKWRLGGRRYIKDNTGIEQTTYQFINQKSGLVIKIGSLPHRNAYMTTHFGSADQMLYFRTRGKELKNGRLVNQKSGRCLEVANSGAGLGQRVTVHDCTGALDEYWILYENGELMNKASGFCMDVAGYNGHGAISMYYCESAKDQLWHQPRDMCVGDYCAFMNKKAKNTCLDVSGHVAHNGAETQTLTCDGAPDNRFKWIS